MCNLTPGQLWNLTPAEAHAIIRAKIAERDSDRQFSDILNAKVCTMIAALGGVSSKPIDYMITELPAGPVREMSDEECEKNMDAWVLASREMFKDG